MAGKKFQIRSRRWDIGIAVASVVLVVLGFGGLFLLQSMGNSTGTRTQLFVIALGVVTFGLFAGPGLVYVLRKRVKKIKDLLPGGTMTWIRSHLYLPVAALVAAWVHASVVPFRSTLSSGKVLVVLGILVSVAGMARHHLIGIQKAAINVNVAVSKLTTGQPRAFRRLVAAYTDNEMNRQEVDVAMAELDPSLQERWGRIKDISDEVEKHFPRDGGQRWQVRQYKFWRAIHPPLTIALFLVLAFHVWDVLGGTRAVAGEEQAFASASECADCHGDVFDEWASSTMSHAQTSTINEAQLPITLSENARVIEQFDGSEALALLTGRDLEEDSQADLVEANAAVCINCHAPVGSSFVDDPFTLLPFGDEGSASLGDDGVAVAADVEAIQADGVGCIVCHTQEVPPDERQGNAALLGGSITETGGLGSLGDFFGPPFVDPNPLPVRIHTLDTPDDDGFWRDDVETSQLCGACHNVKLDMDGDGISEDDTREQGILDLIDDAEDLDVDADFILDENELDDDRVQTANGTAVEDDGGDGLVDDLVLQTTYDEWQDYVAYFDADGGFEDRYADVDGNPEGPLGCSSCHMPFGTEGTEAAVVDYAPGFLPIPERLHREHTFVGVDYDLEPDLYREHGLSDDDIARVLAERDALVQSSVTLEVLTPEPFDATTGAAALASVVVRNNQLAHSFPTGFAFARQFWLEVAAEGPDGEPICLVPAFTDEAGVPIGAVPCGSGFADAEGSDPVEGDQELRQCDTRAFATELGFDPDELVADPQIAADAGIVLPNLDIRFAEGGAFAPAECDPWLANFQKILTDGDPDGDGERQEVPYQPLLPDAVKIRGQVALGQQMFELQPVRLRADAAADSTTVNYLFALPEGLDASQVSVTARLRFRHVPPYFVRDLERRQDELGDAVPEGARIDADELLAHLAVSEVVSATSGEGPELECEGPQNDGDATILDCIDDDDLADAADRLDLGSGGGGGGVEVDRGEEGHGAVPVWSPVFALLLVPFARRRLAKR